MNSLAGGLFNYTRLKKMIKIAVDCYGGDNSPAAPVEGALAALAAQRELSVALTGNEERIRELLKNKSYDSGRLEIYHAPDVIGCDEKPTDAIRLKKDSSLMRGIRLLREDMEVGGLVSTGSTGALVAAATLKIGRLRNVIRPAFCPVLPTMNGGLCGVCDSGASVDVGPDYLMQFAIMGSLYMEYMFDVRNPRVALLNIGVEEEKGDDLRKRAYALLRRARGINVIGNIEARDVLAGAADLVVCDGFSGNVLLKATEGACLEMLKKLKTDISSNFIYKIGAAFMSGMFKKEKEFMNYQNYGGSVMLGLSKVIVKGHGSSEATAVAKCIDQAYRMRSVGLAGRIEDVLKNNESILSEGR